MRRLALIAVALCCGALTGPAASGAAYRPPVVEQMVVFANGKAVAKKVRAKATTARVGRRRCAIAAGTPLAVLVRSKPGRLGLEDFGQCSRRHAADGGQIYVRSIRGDREKGRSGWVYKVGRRLGTAGAGDVSGSFGNGRLRKGKRVTWFYCTLKGATCQRTLELKASAVGGGRVSVAVRAYDDEGRGRPAAGAVIKGGPADVTAGPDGRATLTLSPGRRRIYAVQTGLVRSFSERVTVR
jgi:hypothetical protein